jgi:choline dehydrogenase-like flavoprotein
MMTEISEYEYIVVGSGAGGGTLAVRLAEAGHSVLILEAGGDPRRLQGGDAIDSNTNRMPLDYDVPAFHAFASENDAIKWDYFVRHYSDLEEQKLDWKFSEAEDGVLYPRAGTLGGCTAHNAQILIYPFDADWDYIHKLTGDLSWRPEAMRRHFQRLENCRYRPVHRFLAKLRINPTGHGWRGWLNTEIAIPRAAVREGNLFRTIAAYALKALELSGNPVRGLKGLVETYADPNDIRFSADNLSGICYTPMTTRNHARMGTRERILWALSEYPNLALRMHALVSRVILDQNNRAVGVEYLQGERLYRAHARASAQEGNVHMAKATREVILCGGAFNSPQLLMLSGIGPSDHLESLGIKVLADLPGVGKNLQDRYEIGVVNRMHCKEWEIYKDALFAAGDPQFQQWETCRSGIYASNGTLLNIFKHSPVADGPPDLFCMALLTDFRGYYPNYSSAMKRQLNYLTFVVLKARTRNCAGEVRLRSTDPRDMPLINFRYFQQGGEEDLEAIVNGIEFVRKLTDKIGELNKFTEEVPGASVQSKDDLKSFIRRNAWGHHASCTCAIGPADQGGVLSSDFRVHGVEGLRVVDASVFPRIPGTFIVSAIYMVAEKAAEAILAKSEKSAGPD